MGARVRLDERTKRLYLDLHWERNRQRVCAHLPDTPINRRVLDAKAEAIEREIFLGTFSIHKHFPELTRPEPRTFRELAAEWLKKKQSEVSPLTLDWYRENIDKKILPFWGSKDLTHFSPTLADHFKAKLAETKLAPRTVNIVLKIFR